MNIAVFVSGNGTNLQAIIDAVKKDYIKAKIALIVSDNKEAYALKRAQKAGIETISLDARDFKSKEDFDKEIINNLKKHDIGLVALAGYMRLLTPYFIKEYRNRILNVHPALLPSFKGKNGVKDALDYGVKVTGPTVHFVTEDIDRGPIVSQVAVSIKDDDTEDSLRKRIHEEEHKIYTKAIKDFVEGKLEMAGRKVLHK
ncbi:MAG: phosphoribosylglycinamide formyltransferase [Candidatus Omnitrophica bacterium]|nr:phosphoribosylglycinamide formyltransferase [Candidatus Omnitrophota bacterium]MBU4487721.1 phosphoribosylglycinamide formyltransferase [Candidatus Omnitrophota bacterium]MCG2705261.1 phosphoribosylglycinamide formyltransferase [Candidatus Omnitrophota bacterium]